MYIEWGEHVVLFTMDDSFVLFNYFYRFEINEVLTFVALLKKNCKFIICVNFTAIPKSFFFLDIIFKVVGKMLKSHTYKLKLLDVEMVILDFFISRK